MEAETKGTLPPQPEDRLTILYGEKDNRQPKELFFSFLRQNSVLRFIDNPAQVINLKVNPDTAEAVLRIMLADKGGPGKMMEFELDEDLIANEDVDKILDWVQGHLTYFFMKQFQEMAEKAKHLEPTAKALQLSALGSESSTSETASAGPST